MSLFKKYTIDPEIKKIVMSVFMNDPLSFMLNKEIKMIEDGLVSYPASEDLKEYGIKVIDFRELKTGDYFITCRGLIAKHTPENPINDEIYGGRRFIIEKAQ